MSDAKWIRLLRSRAKGVFSNQVAGDDDHTGGHDTPFAAMRRREKISAVRLRADTLARSADRADRDQRSVWRDVTAPAQSTQRRIGEPA
jgi:hypothetical protein